MDSRVLIKKRGSLNPCIDHNKNKTKDNNMKTHKQRAIDEGSSKIMPGVYLYTLKSAKESQAGRHVDDPAKTFDFKADYYLIYSWGDQPTPVSEDQLKEMRLC